MQFTQATRQQLRFYVYALIDPRDQQIFYVGRASANNRAFDHLKPSTSEPRLQARIREIRATGLEPLVEVLRYGLETEAAALEVEAALIDAIGLKNLTNAKRGHGIERGRMTLSEVERLHGAQPVVVTEIPDPCMVFFIHNSYTPTQTEMEIYDSVRQWWHQVSEKNRTELTYRIALGVVDSVVIRAYTIEGWFRAGTTMSSRVYTDGRLDKWEFVGQKIDDYPLVGRRLLTAEGKPLPGVQKGYTYLRENGQQSDSV